MSRRWAALFNTKTPSSETYYDAKFFNLNVGIEKLRVLNEDPLVSISVEI